MSRGGRGPGRPQGLIEPNLSPSTPHSFIKFGFGELQFKNFSLKGQEKGKKKRQPEPFSGTPAEGMWQLVVLLLTSVAVNNAFSSSLWSPGSFRLLIFY